MPALAQHGQHSHGGASKRLTLAIGEAQGRLRADHLKTHLETTAMLTPEQVDRYVKARGY